MITNVYWYNRGKYQNLAERLEKMIPLKGSVKNPRKNKALEKFRKAANCYYDLYNNGLCNRANQFRQVFGIPSSKFVKERNVYRSKFTDELYELVEQQMDQIILAAAKEQRLI